MYGVSSLLNEENELVVLGQYTALDDEMSKLLEPEIVRLHEHAALLDRELVIPIIVYVDRKEQL